MNRKYFDIFLGLMVIMSLIVGTISIIKSWPCPSASSSIETIFK